MSSREGESYVEHDNENEGEPEGTEVLDSDIDDSDELKNIITEVVDKRPDDFAEMSDFGRATVLLMESYEKGRGRNLDPPQVKALSEGLLDMATTIQGGIAYTEQIEAELNELKGKKKLWSPRSKREE